MGLTNHVVRSQWQGCVSDAYYVSDDCNIILPDSREAERAWNLRPTHHLEWISPLRLQLDKRLEPRNKNLAMWAHVNCQCWWNRDQGSSSGLPDWSSVRLSTAQPQFSQPDIIL